MVAGSRCASSAAIVGPLRTATARPPAAGTACAMTSLGRSSVPSSIPFVTLTTGTPGVAGSGSLTISGSAFQTAGDLRLTAYGALNLGGSIATSNGDIRLQADSLTLGSLVTAGGGGNVQLFTNTGEDLYDSTRRTHAMRPDFFAYAELQGGSHDIIDEQPDNWVREVVRFLRA